MRRNRILAMENMKTLTLREWQELDDVKIMQTIPSSVWNAPLRLTQYVQLREGLTCDFSASRGNTQSAGALADNSKKEISEQKKHCRSGLRDWFNRKWIYIKG